MSLPMFKDGITLDQLMFTPDTSMSIVGNSLNVGQGTHADRVLSQATGMGSPQSGKGLGA